MLYLIGAKISRIDISRIRQWFWAWLYAMPIPHQTIQDAAFSLAFRGNFLDPQKACQHSNNSAITGSKTSKSQRKDTK